MDSVLCGASAFSVWRTPPLVRELAELSLDNKGLPVSFDRLREALEREIERASKSEPMDEKGSVRASMRAKKLLAPDVAAVRFLRLAREQQKSA